MSSRYMFGPSEEMITKFPCDGCIVYPIMLERSWWPPSQMHILIGCRDCPEWVHYKRTYIPSVRKYNELIIEMRCGLRVAGEFGP